MSENQIAEGIVEAAFRVHRHFGPGLLENAYEACLAHELLDMGFNVEKQVALPLVYREVKLDAGYRLDLWVERRVIIEVKAVADLHPVHFAQMITYLKLTGNGLGLIINFHSSLLKDGIRRVVNNLREE
ncbi:MAG: GxxExxY protein [Flavobacteriales bacterium]|nr:GxxExxY protein [Flavobacteriales bacterium]MBK6945767.1 GxxExxY protein [Flavobacteriales bacterium]MBK7241866.1 GxxExxY protein [Flavobacteriales bacterium]MBK7298811.1 GxxExxY protein [Flavobacteriales bacterium]MBK9534683.1 GxxExxY protein [Flavobacteriales bacterium]